MPTLNELMSQDPAIEAEELRCTFELLALPIDQVNVIPTATGHTVVVDTPETRYLVELTIDSVVVSELKDYVQKVLSHNQRSPEDVPLEGGLNIEWETGVCGVQAWLKTLVDMKIVTTEASEEDIAGCSEEITSRFIFSEVHKNMIQLKKKRDQQ